MLRILSVFFLCLVAMPALASKASLNAAYTQNAARLDKNAFGRPLVLDSKETRSSLMGEAYARIDQPFEAVSEKLHEPGNWCELLLLPFNIKKCSNTGASLSLNVGRKFDQDLDDTYPLEFAWETKSEDGYLQVQLKAPEGPVGTRDYEILFEAAPAGDGKTFLHLSYAYGYSFASKLATQAYFATSARGKVGFSTVEGKQVGGLRGAIERNAMRYTLAIEAFLTERERPSSERFEAAMARWFDATEKYPKQLHEMDRAEYLAMKKKEWLRQKSGEAQHLQQAAR